MTWRNAVIQKWHGVTVRLKAPASPINWIPLQCYYVSPLQCYYVSQIPQAMLSTMNVSIKVCVGLCVCVVCVCCVSECASVCVHVWVCAWHPPWVDTLRSNDHTDVPSESTSVCSFFVVFLFHDSAAAGDGALIAVVAAEVVSSSVQNKRTCISSLAKFSSFTSLYLPVTVSALSLISFHSYV